jgi:dTDP-4-amino-4,6-dideoxygalactose transaminase
MTTPTTPDRLASQGGTPVRDKYLPLAVPSIGPREKALVLETLESGWITTGPKAGELGTRIAELSGAKHGLAVSSATAALHLGLVATGVKTGDEVIVPTNTFVACANVIEHCGARPVLVDIEPDTLCVDPRAVEAALTPKTRAIMPVDLGGHPSDLDAIEAIAAPRRLPIIEDAAHALGAAWGDRPVGSRATVTAFSFYATKNLTTGEGGAAVCNDEELHERMRSLSLHGMSRDAWLRYTDKGSWYYEITAPGYKYNLSDVLAAIGVGQLERFADMQRRRREIAAIYDAGLAGTPEVGRPTVRPGITHARHLYALALDLDRLTIDRAVFIRELRAENIGSSVHFIPIHLHPHFHDSLGYAPGSFPVAERAYERTVSLPLFPTMTDRDAEDVCAAVRKIVAHYRR